VHKHLLDHGDMLIIIDNIFNYLIKNTIQTMTNAEVKKIPKTAFIFKLLKLE